MPTLAGALARAAIGGLVNPSLTVDMNSLSAARGDGVVSAARPGGAVPVTHWPVSASSRQVAGQLCRSYEQDYYDRMHIAPRRIDLGNLVSTQTTTVYLWNAHRGAKSLTVIDGLQDGIDVSGPAAPLLFAAMEEREWQVSVTPAGPSALDASLSWRFGLDGRVTLRITANRIIAWTFVPDWSGGVLERLTWSTDIMQSESGVEQRRALRLAPRRELEATVYAEGRERQLLDLSLFGWGARIWALPIWPDIQLLASGLPAGAPAIACATAGRDFRAGGLAMLRGESAFSSETVEVLDVNPGGLTLKRPTQQAWAAGSRLYPARSAQLAEQPGSERLTDRLDRLDVRFLVVEPCDWPVAMPATVYRGWPVLEQRADESEDLTRAYQRLLLSLDNGAAMPLTTDTASRAFALLQHRWVLAGRTEQAAFRSLLYALRGRQAALWLPTHADDLTLVAIVTSVATTLDVETIGYTRFGQAKPGRRDIRIELRDGTVLHRRITGSSELSTEVERLAIDSALGRQVAPADVLRISWIVLCRLDSDSVEIHHETDADGVARSQALFRGVRDEEFSS